MISYAATEAPVTKQTVISNANKRYIPTEFVEPFGRLPTSLSLIDYASHRRALRSWRRNLSIAGSITGIHQVFTDKDPTENLHNGDILTAECLYSAPELPKTYRESQTLSQRLIVIGLFDFEDSSLAQKIISETPYDIGDDHEERSKNT